MDSIIWAIKHTMRDIADTGLNCKYLHHTHRERDADVPFSVP